MPRGPTLTLRVKSYTSMADVAAMHRKPASSPLAYNASPLVILNNFGAGSAQHIQPVSYTHLTLPTILLV